MERPTTYIGIFGQGDRGKSVFSMFLACAIAEHRVMASGEYNRRDIYPVCVIDFDDGNNNESFFGKELYNPPISARGIPPTDEGFKSLIQRIPFETENGKFYFDIVPRITDFHKLDPAALQKYLHENYRAIIVDMEGSPTAAKRHMFNRQGFNPHLAILIGDEYENLGKRGNHISNNDDQYLKLFKMIGMQRSMHAMLAIFKNLLNDTTDSLKIAKGRTEQYGIDIETMCASYLLAKEIDSYTRVMSLKDSELEISLEERKTGKPSEKKPKSYSLIALCKHFIGLQQKTGKAVGLESWLKANKGHWVPFIEQAARSYIECARSYSSNTPSQNSLISGLARALPAIGLNLETILHSGAEDLVDTANKSTFIDETRVNNVLNYFKTIGKKHNVPLHEVAKYLIKSNKDLKDAVEAAFIQSGHGNIANAIKDATLGIESKDWKDYVLDKNGNIHHIHKNPPFNTALIDEVLRGPIAKLVDALYNEVNESQQLKVAVAGNMVEPPKLWTDFWCPALYERALVKYNIRPLNFGAFPFDETIKKEARRGNLLLGLKGPIYKQMKKQWFENPAIRQALGIAIDIQAEKKQSLISRFGLDKWFRNEDEKRMERYLATATQ